MKTGIELIEEETFDHAGYVAADNIIEKLKAKLKHPLKNKP